MGTSVRGAVSRWIVATVLLAAVGDVGSVSEPGAVQETAAVQRAEYEAESPKTIVALQQFRRTSRVATDASGDRRGVATLVDLNPTIGAWYLLTLDWGDGRSASYHLENGSPGEQTISLREGLRGVVVASGGEVHACELWSGSPSALEQARRSSLPYAPLCGDRIFLRNPAGASPTELERVTAFLRDHVWGGEKIISFVRKEFFTDRFLEKGTPGTGTADSQQPALEDGPLPAMLDEPYCDRCVVPEHLSIDLGVRALSYGRWYATPGVPGVHVSVIAPQALAPDVLRSYPGRASKLDGAEAGALAYLVAFDLGQLELGFVLGTEHPRVAWSERALRDVRDPELPGPDGIGTASPLVTNGAMSPAVAPRTVATFVGGFKRQHGAFRHGALAHENHGSHYGFVEQGTVFSKLVPGLATIYVLDDGSAGMKTWTRDDDVLLPRIRHARQNGVPLVEPDPATGAPRPGSLVSQWGAGNWSGSADEKLRTVRAGACLQERGSRRFLLYGWFSSATPSAMARVFQGYQCRYAMHLDMNALEHTYLAVYLRDEDAVVVQHLVSGMSVVDRSSRGRLVPRFIAAPDNRDFFYLVLRGSSP